MSTIGSRARQAFGLAFPRLALRRLALAGGLLAIACAQPSWARSGEGLTGRLLDGLAERRAEIERATGVLGSLATGTGALMFYDPGADVAGAVDERAYDDGDRAWVEAALAVYDLHRQLGGARPDRRQHFRRDANGFFVGVEGGAGAWHDSAERALAYYFRLLGSTAEPRPGAVTSTAHTAAGGGILALVDALSARVREQGDLVALRPGETATVLVPGVDFAVGSPDLEVRTSVTGDGVTARVTARSGSETPQAIYGFDAGRRFRSSEAIEVSVDHTAATADDGESTRPGGFADPVPLVGRVAGAIDVPGDVGVFTVEVSERGRYTVVSNGPSDVSAVLLDAEGNTIASDDDGGSAYNFRLEGDLGAGSYRLEVRHCCGGTGPYDVSIEPSR